jgi:hypothetical protein
MGKKKNHSQNHGSGDNGDGNDVMTVTLAVVVMVTLWTVMVVTMVRMVMGDDGVAGDDRWNSCFASHYSKSTLNSHQSPVRQYCHPHFPRRRPGAHAVMLHSTLGESKCCDKG